MERRKFIKNSTLVIAAAPFLKGKVYGKGLGSPNVLKGFIVSDAHFGWRNDQQPSLEVQGKMIARIHERFPDLDLFLDTGDAHHGSLGPMLNSARRDWSDTIANQSNHAPFYYVPGNHDIINPVDGDAELRCCQLGSISYRPYYSFDIKGIHFVSIPELEHPVYVNKETLDWLRLDLSLNREKSIILLSHNNLKGTTGDDNFMLGYRGLANSEDIINLIKAYPNILAWMHGHNHDYVIKKSHGRLFVSNGRIGGFNPSRNSEEGEPLGGMYFEISRTGLKVQSYSAEHNAFLDEDMGRPGRSRTLRIGTTLSDTAPMSYAFGHGGFLDGQKAAVYNYHTSTDDSFSVVLAGTTDFLINENSEFLDYTHRNDNPSRRQWNVFGYDISSGTWPQYFEEKNEFWRWLSPGVLLYKRKASKDTTSLHLPAQKHGKEMYFRTVPNQSYTCGLILLSGKGGQQLEMLARAYSQKGKLLWEKRFPSRDIKPGESKMAFQVDLPDLSEGGTIYDSEKVDTEIQLAMEARFSCLDSELIISRATLTRKGASGTTEDPKLIIGGKVVSKEGPLVLGDPFEKKLKKPKGSRLVIEGQCGGSRRMLWYCRQDNIDWQVRNAPVADHGTWLEVDAPTNTWSTGKEIVIVPAANTLDTHYVHRLKNVTRARVWPLNRGNKELSVEIHAADGDSGAVEIRSDQKPEAVNGPAQWEYRDGAIYFTLSTGKRATVII
ncbi:hypothetical protein G0Q06_03945 [Puniceicoccales bacterium CK1056]|uniref:Calcineurin-like phosphoesterase domain-containing protein n=1 Tax=Oceanipulchritudo coccoides TaxID=2706888 RepID=A0A6B2M092_9BACT|nr:metallophosphoesterase [Oceanipulchritudo coccoides]NDV61594.1 hypothetical protein [Oceanipulchritudo coccoides]